MVFDQNAVHIHAASADRNLAGIGGDGESVGGGCRNDGAADDVKRAGLNPAVQLLHPLIPVGIELRAPLLHDDTKIIVQRIKDIAADVETHARSPY